MNKFTILRYFGDDSRRMTDILDDLYFVAENWEGYAKYNLPVIITNQWKKYKDKTGGFISKGTVVSKVNMHFIDNLNLTGPVVDGIELELGDSKHIARLWTDQGLKYDPVYKGKESLITRAGVSKKKALVVMIMTKDTYSETWDRLYEALEKIGLECEMNYHTEAIYEIGGMNMRYEVYKLANVDSIKDVDLLNKFWSILLNAGMRLSGQEVLLYTVDTRGEVNVFVNPNPTSVKECVLAFKGPEDEGKEVSISDTEYEIVAPAYIEIFISDYTRVIRCTDELSDDELNALSFDHTKNNFAKIRHSKKPAAPFQIRKVEDLEDLRIREKCRVAMNGHDSVDESLYLISNDDHWYVAKISEMICLDNFD